MPFFDLQNVPQSSPICPIIQVPICPKGAKSRSGFSRIIISLPNRALL
nr:MAG TPA: hypothetical protein [Caudoviricetes sp.]